MPQRLFLAIFAQNIPNVIVEWCTLCLNYFSRVNCAATWTAYKEIRNEILWFCCWDGDCWRDGDVFDAGKCTDDMLYLRGELRSVHRRRWIEYVVLELQ